MKVLKASLLDGAKQAKGVVVVIDVFRAGNTILSLLEKGFQRVIPVSSLQESLALKQANPDWLLLGERQGIKPEGFELNNSPAGVMALEKRDGGTAILTTSAGTQGLAAATGAESVVIGTFGNVSAVATWIQEKNPPLVTLVAMGNGAKRLALEDEVFADYLKALLTRKEFVLGSHWVEIMEDEGTKRLKTLGQHDDLELCLQLDWSQKVPVLSRFSGRMELKNQD